MEESNSRNPKNKNAPPETRAIVLELPEQPHSSDDEDDSVVDNNDKSDNGSNQQVSKDAKENRPPPPLERPKAVAGADDEQEDDTTHRSTGRKRPSLVEEGEKNPSSTTTDPLLALDGTNRATLEEEEVPIHTTKRPRRVSPYPTTERGWDDFCRRGARLQTLVSEALTRVASSSATSMETHKDETPTPPPRLSIQTAHDHAAELAREKTAECMILEQKLQESRAEVAALAASNESLRTAASSHQSRLERTTQALRIAGTNAAQARSDADAAEATAARLSQQLGEVQQQMEDVQRTHTKVKQEHDQVHQAARAVERQWVAREAEFVRLQAKQRQLVDQQQDWDTQQHQWQSQVKSLQQQVARAQDELHQRAHQINEYQALQEARATQLGRVETELRHARSLLVDAAAVAADTETTTSLLKETLKQLQMENEKLHGTLQECQEEARSAQARSNESLQTTEQQVQSLKLQAASHQDDLQRLRLDKSSSDKQVGLLKTRIANLERRLQEATSLVPPSPRDEPSKSTTPKTRRSSASGSSTTSFTIPPLQAATPSTAFAKTTTTLTAPAVTPAATKVRSNMCCLCAQPASGFMKSCQCGASCDKRAHSTCLARHHGGSSAAGAPRAPLVLCKAASD